MPKKSEPCKFVREGDFIIKVGAGYEHKAPKEVFDILAAAVGNIGLNGDPFKMDRIINAYGTRKTPTHQIYLCMKYLTDCEIVKTHDRGEYKLAERHIGKPADSAENPLNTIKMAWEILETREPKKKADTVKSAEAEEK